jgi:ribosome-binding protein aMBF1 (putative translation factor)
MNLRFDGAKVAFDMAGNGWDVPELATRAKVSVRTVYRFISGELQTHKSAKKLAVALGFSVRRYQLPTVAHPVGHSAAAAVTR